MCGGRWNQVQSGWVWLKGRWQSWQHRFLHLLTRLMDKLKRVREGRAKREGIWYPPLKTGKKPENWKWA